MAVHRATRKSFGLVALPWQSLFAFLSALLLVCVYAVILWNCFVGHVGLSYDEALNYGTSSVHGIVYSLTHYREPNNHLLITSLNALIPKEWVSAWPPLMRLWLPGWIILFVYAIWSILHHHLNMPKPVALLAALALPLSTTTMGMYLLWVRGYLPGTAMLLMGIASLAEAGRREGWLVPVPGSAPGHRWRSLIWFSLSAWCVPSFLLPACLAIALTVLYLILARGGRFAASYAVLLPALLLIVMVLYGGVLTQLPAASRGWTSDWSATEAFRRILPLGPVAVLGGMAYPLLAFSVPAFFLFRDVRSRRLQSPMPSAEENGPMALHGELEMRRSFLMLQVFGISLLSVAITEAAVRLTILPAPYIRNILYIAPFFWMGLVMLPGRAGRAAMLLVLLLVPFVMWDLSGLSGSHTWNLQNPLRENTVDRALQARQAGLPCGEECGHEGRLFEFMDRDDRD